MKAQITLSKAIAILLESHPEVSDLIQHEFANISAIAKSIHRDLQALLQRKITLSATGMALRRYIYSLPKTKQKKTIMPLPFEISTRTAIYEVAMRRSSQGRKAVERARALLTTEPDSYFSSSEGLYEIAIQTNQCHKNLIRKALSKERISSEIDNLCCVTANWAPNTKDIPGIYYKVTRALALKEISIQSFQTIGAEMSVFVKEKVLLEAHAALSQLLLGQSPTLNLQTKS